MVNALDEKQYLLYENIGGSVSTKEPLSKNTLTIHPNPSSDYIQIHSERPLKNLNIWNADGALVKHMKYESKLDVSYLPSGIYFIKGEDSDGQISGHFFENLGAQQKHIKII